MLNKLFFLFLLLFSTSLFAQVKDFQVGSANAYTYPRTGGYYDYSEQNTVNIEVNIWGFVKYPGKYLIPEGSTVMDFLSYAGGPNENANMDDMRIYREIIIDDNGRMDTTQTFIPIDYYDLLWSEDLITSGKGIPVLKAGDNISVPGEPKIWDKDWINIGLSVISILISLTTLIVTLGK